MDTLSKIVTSINNRFFPNLDGEWLLDRGKFAVSESGAVMVMLMSRFAFVEFFRLIWMDRRFRSITANGKNDNESATFALDVPTR